MSEAVKHGLIWDASFVQWFDDHESCRLLNRKRLAMHCTKAAAWKASVVSQDERENDLRAILNLGHTIGHAIESGSRCYLDGEAIAIGMVGSLSLAFAMGARRGIHDYEASACQVRAAG